jgi:hypothetical protein
MIMSVSTLTIGMGAATPVSVVNLSIEPCPVLVRPLYTRNSRQAKGCSAGSPGDFA